MQGFLTDDELKKLLGPKGDDTDLLSDDEIKKYVTPPRKLSERIFGDKVADTSLKELITGKEPSKSGWTTTGPVRHALDVAEVIRRTPRKVVEKIEELPQRIREFGAASELRDPAMIAKTGAPVQPFTDPTEIQKEAGMKQFTAGAEILSTVTGPVSVAAGEAAREAGLSEGAALGVELATAIPEGFGAAKLLRAAKAMTGIRAAEEAAAIARAAGEAGVIPKAAAAAPLADDAVESFARVAAEKEAKGVGLEGLVKGGPKEPKFKRFELGDLPDPNEDFGAFAAEAERQAAKEQVKDAGLGFLLEKPPETPVPGDWADLPRDFPGKPPKQPRKPKFERLLESEAEPEGVGFERFAKDKPLEKPAPIKKEKPNLLGGKGQKPAPGEESQLARSTARQNKNKLSIESPEGGRVSGVINEQDKTFDIMRIEAGKGLKGYQLIEEADEFLQKNYPDYRIRSHSLGVDDQGKVIQRKMTTEEILKGEAAGVSASKDMQDFGQRQLARDVAKSEKGRFYFEPRKKDTSFEFSTAKDIAEDAARVEGLGKAKKVKGFNPETHSLSDFVAMEGGVKKGLESSAEAGAYDLTKGRSSVGVGSRQWFKENGIHPDDMIQRLREKGFLRPDEEFTADDLLRYMDEDIRAKSGMGGTRHWSNLKQDIEEGISNIGRGIKNLFDDEAGHGQMFTDLANAVGNKINKSGVKAAVSSVWRHWGRPYTSALKKMGPYGREMARRVEGFRNYHEPRVSEAVTRYKDAVRDLSDVEFGSVYGKQKRGGNLVDVLDKGHKPMNARVEAAAKEVRALTDEVVRQARVHGWDIGELENYFPHRLEKNAPVPGHLQPVSGDLLLQHKRAKTYNLERHREKDLVDFRRDKAVLEEYFMESYKQIGELAYFGSRRGPAPDAVRELVKAGRLSAQDAKMIRRSGMGPAKVGMADQPQAIQDLVKQGLLGSEDRVLTRFRLLDEQHAGALEAIGRITNKYDRKKAIEGFLRMTGNEPTTSVEHIFSIARNVNAFMSLSTAAIAQMTQTAHIFAEAPGRALLRGIRDVATDYSQAVKRAELAGSVFANMSKEFQKAAGVGTDKARFMWGLGKVDKFVRVLADSTARNWVEMLEKRVAKGSAAAAEELANLGVKGGRKATEKDFRRIAKLFTDTTQFRVDIPDLPPGMTGSFGKTVFQFGSFMYAHARWLLKPAIRGPGAKNYIIKLSKYVAAAAVVGETAQAVRSLFLRYDLIGEDVKTIDYNDIKSALSRASGTRRIPPNHPFWRAIQNISYVGGAGIFQMMYENMMRPGGIETVTGSLAGRAADIKRDLFDPAVQGRADEIRYDAVLRRQLPNLIKRQAWDRIFGDPEETSRRRRSTRERRARRQ